MLTIKFGATVPDVREMDIYRNKKKRLHIVIVVMS